MTPTVEQQLCEHARALRSLACDLVGAQRADDLVQDVALHAMSRPPRRGGALGGWLAGMLRHLASKQRRGERRRFTREQRAARPEALPPADHEAVLADSMRRLTDAVLALPQPYREAVLLRYLGELPPAEIASRTGAPLATVKSQLQRGLAQLRARLDADGKGNDWRGALCAGFGFERALPVAAAATGAIVMGTGTKVVLGVAAALLAVVAWWWSGSGGPAALPTGARVADSGLAPASAGAADDGAAARRELANAGAKDIAVAADRALVRGRCVDERGQPLGNCEVRLNGWYGDGASRDYAADYGAWLVAHPDAFAADAATTSARDGTFAFALPWAPLGLELHLRRDVLDHVVQREPPLRGAVTDLGDLRVPVTTTLRGRVVDTDGVPVAWQFFQLIAKELVDPAGRPAPARYSVLTSDERGEFTAQVVPGICEWRGDRDLVRGKRIEIPVGAAVFAVELVLAKIGATESVAGVVVDDAGQPVPAAWVHVTRGDIGMPATTDDQGRFAYARPRGEPGVEAMIRVTKKGYDDLGTQAAWGSRDLRLVLPRHPVGDVELLVLAPGGTPVTEYRVWPAGVRGQVVHPPLTRGHHVDGRMILQLAVGQQGFVVEPDRVDLARSAVVHVQVVAPGPVHVDVRLPEQVERQLRVQGSDGKGCPGVAIELIDFANRPASWNADVVPLARWPDGGDGLLVQRGTTDSNGEMRLRGAADTRVALRLSGPGHPRLLVDDALGDRSPLVVTLSAGARLEARLGPAALVRQMRADNDLPADGSAARGRNPQGRGLRLQARDEKLVVVPSMTEPPIVPAGDGTFAFDCIPASTYELSLLSDDIATVATVELRDGETTRLDLDLPEFVRGELRGRVLLNGKPLANREVQFEARELAGGGDARYRRLTDGDGRFALPVRQSTLRVVLLLSDASVAGTDTTIALRSTDTVFVPVGAQVEHEFHIDTGKLHIRVLGGDGKPVAGVSLRFDGADGRRNLLAPTDADGVREVEIDVGDYTLQTFPRRLQSNRAQSELEKQLGNGPGVLAPYRLTLGTIAVRAGATVERTITLPPEFDR